MKCSGSYLLKIYGMALAAAAFQPLYGGSDDAAYAARRDTSVAQRMFRYLGSKLGFVEIPGEAGGELEKELAAEKLGADCSNLVKLEGTDVWTTKDLKHGVDGVYGFVKGDYAALRTQDGGCILVGLTRCGEPLDTALYRQVVEIVDDFPKDNVIDETEVSIAAQAACEVAKPAD